MIKKALGVIVGYVVMVMFLFISFSIVYMLLGTEGSYQPNSFEVSAVWIVFSLVLGLAAAVLGGMTCFAISKSLKVTNVLAGLILILGIGMAIPTLSEVVEQPLVRDGEVGDHQERLPFQRYRSMCDLQLFHSRRNG